MLAGDISVIGNVRPSIVQIGENVLLSCQVRGCKSSNLQVHLYKWEGSENKTLYLHNSTKLHRVEESDTGRRPDEDQKGQYKNGVLEVPLSQVQQADCGLYVCALTCDDYYYKEDSMEVTVQGKYVERLKHE